ncbi:LLM class flavin-dependent oxidoreductase [Nigerium massiliense]|uniref:LLM class flavin-dependent oxidoreductase n=1 Tax=Nigerium massiliense TaxID=1522317 RepID=UPI00058B8DE4|nr:LLM class flavin-dependent oxidoreductase [Nigerium massiliense]
MNTDSPGRRLQFGLDTFGEAPVDGHGAPLSARASLRQVVDEAKLAEDLGIDIIALGEHHRDDFVISSPETVLAAIASVTERILLGTAVTVLSSDDPVRVYERFATLDGLSNGRAQVMLGRGSFTESFPLFGYDLRDYNTLFEEKIALFAELLKEQPVTWNSGGRTLDAADVFPKTDGGPIDTWVGVGGSPESVVRAAAYGFPMMLAIIGGAADRFAPYADLYRRALAQTGRSGQPLGIHSHGFIGADEREARETYFPGFKVHRGRVGAERGWGSFSRAQFDGEVDHGALYVGTSEQVARKIADTVTLLDLDRFDLVYSAGILTPDQRLASIERYGREVVPLVREMVGR